MPSLVLLGGTGFIGQNLIKELALTFDVTIVSRHPPTFAVPNVKWQNGDYLSLQWNPPKADVLLHLATPSHPSLCNGNLEDILIAQRKAHRHLLDVLPMNTKLILFSSIHVYGADQTEPILESQLCRPISNYGKIKLCAERILSQHPNVTIIRPSQLIGNPPPKRSILDDWLKFFQNNPAGEIETGNLNLIRDFLTIEDAVDGIVSLINHSGGKQIYNLSSGTGTRLSELAKALKIFERCVTSQRLLRDDNAPVLIASNSKIKSLGWSPKMDILKYVSGMGDTQNKF